jgi:hypothetical protein
MVSGEGRVPEACLPVEARSAGAVACCAAAVERYAAAVERYAAAVERCAAAVERCAVAVAAQTWGHSAVASGEART